MQLLLLWTRPIKIIIPQFPDEYDFVSLEVQSFQRLSITTAMVFYFLNTLIVEFTKPKVCTFECKDQANLTTLSRTLATITSQAM